MGRYLTMNDLEALREPLAWCVRTAKKWAVPYTWCLIPERGRFYFGPCDSTLAEKVRRMTRAIWGEDLTAGYRSKTGTPCICVNLNTNPRPRNEWDWETLANI